MLWMRTVVAGCVAFMTLLHCCAGETAEMTTCETAVAAASCGAEGASLLQAKNDGKASKNREIMEKAEKFIEISYDKLMGISLKSWKDVQFQII